MSLPLSALPEQPAPPPCLCVEGLEKEYRLGAERLAVLRGLSLEAQAGELVAIMGPSGSGKTTLLNCISGIDRPDAGVVRLDGEPVDYTSERARTLLRRNSIGIVFQFFNLVPSLTVRENVALPSLIAREGRGEERAEALLARLGLAERAGHYPFQLSGGEMQLASIARSLMRRPRLLLADEPTGNVNPSAGRRIMATLREVARDEGATVLLVTHSPEHAAFADRICFIRDGAIAATRAHGGRADDVLPIHEQLVRLGI